MAVSFNRATPLARAASMVLFLTLAGCAPAGPPAPAAPAPATPGQTPSVAATSTSPPAPPPFPTFPAVAPLANNNPLGVGERGLLAGAGVQVEIHADKATFGEWVSLAVTKDEARGGELLRSGRVIQVPNGTPAQVLEREESLAKVRLLAGEHAGKEGWLLALLTWQEDALKEHVARRVAPPTAVAVAPTPTRLAAAPSPTPPRPPTLPPAAATTPIALKAGERGRVARGLTADATLVPMPLDASAVRAMGEAIGLSDANARSAALQQLLRSGRMVGVNKGSAVEVLEQSTNGWWYKVRVLDGPATGREGWLLAEFLSPEGGSRAPTAAPPKPAAKDEPQTFSGSNIQKTRPFTLSGGAYSLAWKATDTGGFTCVFSGFLTPTTGNMLSMELFANAVVSAGQAQSQESQVYNVRPGQYFLDITSTCDWEVTIRPM